MATQVTMFCEKCRQDTQHWDNRQNKKNPRAPNFKCSMCNNPIWPDKGQKPPTQITPQPLSHTQPASQNESIEKQSCTKTAGTIICAMIEKGLLEDKAGILSTATEFAQSLYANFKIMG